MVQYLPKITGIVTMIIFNAHDATASPLLCYLYSSSQGWIMNLSWRRRWVYSWAHSSRWVLIPYNFLLLISHDSTLHTWFGLRKSDVSFSRGVRFICLTKHVPVKFVSVDTNSYHFIGGLKLVKHIHSRWKDGDTKWMSCCGMVTFAKWFSRRLHFCGLIHGFLGQVICLISIQVRVLLQAETIFVAVGKWYNIHNHEGRTVAL